MSSEYLGWQERKPPREFDRFDRDVLPGGPVTQGFENYVKSIFRPEGAQEGRPDLPAGACGLSGDPKVSAAAILKMEEHLGKEALDDSRKSLAMTCYDPSLGLCTDLSTAWSDSEQ